MVAATLKVKSPRLPDGLPAVATDRVDAAPVGNGVTAVGVNWAVASVGSPSAANETAGTPVTEDPGSRLKLTV